MAMVNSYFFSLHQQRCTSGLVVRMQGFMPVVLGSIPTCDAVFCLRILSFASFFIQVFFLRPPGPPAGGRRCPRQAAASHACTPPMRAPPITYRFDSRRCHNFAT